MAGASTILDSYGAANQLETHRTQSKPVLETFHITRTLDNTHERCVIESFGG
jgi:hypothetical protein